MYIYDNISLKTLNLLTTTIVASPSNASKWQMGFNSAFKGLIVVRIRNVSDKICGQKTHSLRSLTFSPENHAVNEIMWKNMVQLDGPQITI